MFPAIRTVAVLTLVSACFAAAPARAEPRSGTTVNDVCFPAFDLCKAACDINSPDDGLTFGAFLANEACKANCEEQLLACTDPEGHPARKMSIKTLTGPTFGMDGTSSGKGKGKKPVGDTDPPADPDGNDGKGGGFEVHMNFGGSNLMFSPD
jgi:hypothetical protein